MSLELQREPVDASKWPESLPMLFDGFEEFDPHPELGLDLDLEFYETLERLGRLRAYTARLDARLIGYAIFVVARSPRRRYLTQAQQDTIHVLKEHRPRVTPALVLFAERALRAEGVKLVYHSCPVGSRFGTMLERLGYPAVAQVHAKRL